MCSLIGYQVTLSFYDVEGNAQEKEEGFPPTWLIRKQECQSPLYQQTNALVCRLIRSTCFLTS